MNSDSPVVFEPETAQDQEQLSRAFEDQFIAQDRQHEAQRRASRCSKVGTRAIVVFEGLRLQSCPYVLWQRYLQVSDPSDSSSNLRTLTFH